jgi:UDP-2,3-diacylglucosamine pyrophosphatase LpxH
VISDLHLAAGINASSNYQGTENFFADQSFARFIDHIDNKKPSAKSILVINGDFIDFLRICDYPSSDKHFANWEEILSIAGIHKSQEELRDSIIKKEKIFGLRTDDYKSVWKLHICMLGHKVLFERLASWVNDGNELLITKGNHDLEWYWPPVQKYLQFYLARLLSQKLNIPVNKLLPSINERTSFADHSIIIDKKIYIEHGHCYESTTAVQGNVLSDNRKELNLPFGSFFNRYLINKIELVYPFIDNVRPRQNILLVLFRERFPLAIKMIFYYVPFTLLLIPKKMWWQIFKLAITFILIIILPLAITAFAIYQGLPHGAHPTQSTPWLLQQILNVAKNLGFLFLSYLFGRIMTFVKLSAPSSFVSFAENVMIKNAAIEVVTFGHTHNPEQKNLNGKWYFNTGTWMPVFEASSADIRIDKTYTFLQLEYDSAQQIIITPLQRWNDDALRDDYLPLIETK